MKRVNDLFLHIRPSTSLAGNRELEEVLSSGQEAFIAFTWYSPIGTQDHTSGERPADQLGDPSGGCG